MADERIEVEIVLDDGSVRQGFARIKKEADRTGKSLKKSLQLDDTFRDLQSVFFKISAVFAGFSFVKTAISNFAEFEKRLVAVGKTSNITGPALLTLGERIKDIGRDIPAATDNLLELAKTAGQFGVQGTNNIIAFTETLAKLELATDIVGEDGAKSLARILSVTGEATGTVGRLGAVITDLGNNFAASEREILSVATEVAKITSVFGASSAEVAGISAALKQSGVAAEAGGTAVGKAFIAINKAISSGGNILEKFSIISGKTSKQLREDFAENSVKSFQDLIKGLNNVSKAGGDVTKVLGEIGLNDVRVTKSLLPLIKNYSILEDALRRANKQAIDQTALNKEAGLAANTLSGDLTKLSNSFSNLVTSIGKLFGPSARGAAQLFRDFADSIGDLVKVLRADIVGDIAKLELELGGITEAIEFQERKIQQQLGKSDIAKTLLNVFGGNPEETKARLEEQAKAVAERLTSLRDSIRDQEAEAPIIKPILDSFQKLPEATGLTFQTLGEAFTGFGELLLQSFNFFSENINKTVEFSTEQSKALATGFRNTLVSGITSTITATVSALVKGENAFEAFGKSILNLVGDLAIFIGQFIVAAGVAKLALEALPGGAAIAAGFGLIALGALLKAIGGNSFVGGTGAVPAGGGGAAAPTADDALLEPEDEGDIEKTTAVTINVDGTIIDPRTTGENIAGALQEFFDTSGGQLVVNS